MGMGRSGEREVTGPRAAGHKRSRKRMTGNPKSVETWRILRVHDMLLCSIRAESLSRRRQGSQHLSAALPVSGCLRPTPYCPPFRCSRATWALLANVRHEPRWIIVGAPCASDSHGSNSSLCVGPYLGLFGEFGSWRVLSCEDHSCTYICT